MNPKILHAIIGLSLAALPLTGHAQQSATQTASPLAFAPIDSHRMQRAIARPKADPPVLAHQSLGTLETGIALATDTSTVVDMRFLEASSDGFETHYLQTSGLAEGLAMLAAMYSHAGVPASAEEGGCDNRVLILSQQAKRDPGRILELLELELAANPGCACELVKAAIQAVDANPDMVAAIVEVAVLTAPEHLRMIGQCAIAANPDALAAVQDVLARLDPHGSSENGSAKSAKSAKDEVATAVASMPSPPNPLDLPPPDLIPPPPVFPESESPVDP